MMESKTIYTGSGIPLIATPPGLNEASSKLFQPRDGSFVVFSDFASACGCSVPSIECTSHDFREIFKSFTLMSLAKLPAGERAHVASDPLHSMYAGHFQLCILRGPLALRSPCRGRNDNGNSYPRSHQTYLWHYFLNPHVES
jgi:hypothetical protein